MITTGRGGITASTLFVLQRINRHHLHEMNGMVAGSNLGEADDDGVLLNCEW